MIKQSDAPDWSYQETKEYLLNIEDALLRDFSIFAYSLGGRINEVRFLKPKDINRKVLSDGSERLIVTLLTEKNPKTSQRFVPMNPVNEPEYSMTLWEWKKFYGPESLPFQYRTTRWFQYRLKQEIGIHPHALRHLRVHHVDDNTVPGMKPLTPRQFQDFFGWETISTSSHYQSRTRSKDLAEKM